MGRPSEVSPATTTTNTSCHHCSVRISTSDEYVTRRMTSRTHEGIWRSPEPTEEQQPVPGPSRVRAAQRGPAFPVEEQSSVPRISTEDDTRPFLCGSNRTWSSSLQSGLPPPTTSSMRSLLSGSNRMSCPSSGTNPFFLPGYQMPRNYLGHDTQNQGERYPSPTSPFMYQNQGRTLSPLTSGQMTLTNQIHQMKPPTPIPSPTWSINEETAIPSMQEGGDYEWPILTDRDWEILGPHRTAAWELRQQDFDARAGWPHTLYPPSPYGLLPRQGHWRPTLGQEK